uniref:Uncharacterized protein n=1 Tax=Sarcophilus harrisii TaxID=9305 RepID=A0A7N4PBX9_SARHA
NAGSQLYFGDGTRLTVL